MKTETGFFFFILALLVYQTPEYPGSHQNRYLNHGVVQAEKSRVSVTLDS